jgi:hypothetical protein
MAVKQLPSLVEDRVYMRSRERRNVVAIAVVNEASLPMSSLLSLLFHFFVRHSLRAVKRLVQPRNRLAALQRQCDPRKENRDQG